MKIRYLFSFFMYLFFLSFIPSARAEVENYTKIKGVRVDSGYLYDSFFKNIGIRDANSAARIIVADVKEQGANTIFLLAYNSVYGALYPTNYSHTIVEPSFGKGDLLGHLINEAHASGIRVVAWLPVNDFKHVWQNNPDWRSKKRNGTDYSPNATVKLLSAWHDGFQNWYQGFLEDLLVRYPQLDGIEAAEGQVDFNWNGSADYNPVANQKFLQRYPNGVLGDSSWKKFRADGLTHLHRILSTVAHKAGRTAWVVQTWTARNDAKGTLMTSQEIANGCGFDFDGIMNLPHPGRPDVVAAELMWQQWRNAHNNKAFTPEWTSYATKTFVANVAGRVTAMSHIELSPFGTVAPTNAQFKTSLKHAFSHSQGADYYDYAQVKRKNASSQARSVFLDSTFQ